MRLPQWLRRLEPNRLPPRRLPTTAELDDRLAAAYALRDKADAEVVKARSHRRQNSLSMTIRESLGIGHEKE